MTTTERRKIEKAEALRNRQLDEEKALLPQFNGFGLIGNHKPDPTVLNQYGVIEARQTYNKFIPAVDIPHFWKKIIGGKELLTKKELQQIKEIDLEIERLCEQEAKYSMSAAKREYDGQNFEEPTTLKSLDTIRETYIQAQDHIRAKRHDLIKTKYSLLIEPQKRLYALVRDYDFIKEIQRDFEPLIQKWLVDVAILNDHIQWFKNSNEVFLNNLKSGLFNDFNFFLS